ncbi:flavodoxin [Draconibacterium orientale]|uniref:flavodoxin n=1 Tax=Draconibacterium orientale TaxID=1168034 RepID=UPI0029C0F50A|nr:flavodoxin [Draconibacterium orientale]
MDKILIAYYSRPGQNYVSGIIVDLIVGNTEVVANKIQQMTSGQLFKIDTKNKYPVDYTETTRVAKDELRSNARPVLTNKLMNTDDFDIIYLGYPNWWGTFPMVVFTFLESFDFTGKTIIPFCTHEGSGLGNSIRDIKNCCPDAKVLDGLALFGSVVSKSDSQLEKWLETIK